MPVVNLKVMADMFLVPLITYIFPNATLTNMANQLKGNHKQKAREGDTHSRQGGGKVRRVTRSWNGSKSIRSCTQCIWNISRYD